MEDSEYTTFIFAVCRCCRIVEILLSKIFYLHFGDVSLCALYKFDRGQQMKNYTEIFSQALKMKEGYDVKKAQKNN